ncbi:MAG: hypothetical protein OEV40_30580 [Acidimicrobiia bacterium]|nr:hypothetical protein [Acidimicrobiia bacterium]
MSLAQPLNIDSRVVLDDGEDENETFPNGIPTWNPDPTPYLGGGDNTLRSGDVVTDLSGVVHFAFGEYELHPVGQADPTDPDGGVDHSQPEAGLGPNRRRRPHHRQLHRAELVRHPR